MSFADVLAEHTRLAILRLLEQAPGYAANDSILLSGLEAVGLRCTRDQVKVHVAWLGEQGLVTSETVSHLVVATLTTRGLDVASGRATVPGVKRPSPR